MDDFHQYELGKPFMEFTEYSRMGPDTGFCRKCGQSWLIKEEVVVYCQTERPSLSGKPYVGRTIGSIIDEMMSSVEWNVGLLIDYQVTNPDCRDTNYDPNLADHDIWEEIDPCGFKDTTRDTILVEGDTLTLFVVFFFHRKCVEK